MGPWIETYTRCTREVEYGAFGIVVPLRRYHVYACGINMKVFPGMWQFPTVTFLCVLLNCVTKSTLFGVHIAYIYCF